MEYKTACPRCVSQGRDRSGDNLHMYGEGRGGFCWSCGYTELSDFEKSKRGLNKWVWDETKEKELSKERITEAELISIKEKTTTHGYEHRAITDETYKVFGVRFESENDKVFKTYYPYTEGWKASGYKVRLHNPKDFRAIGRTGKQCDLFGSWKWKAGGKTLCIFCGEEDTMAGYQMLEDYRKSKNSQFDATACVSSSIGEAGSIKQFQEVYDWLNSWEKIVYFPDLDEAGQAVLEDVALVMPKGKLFIGKIGEKDVNEMLKKGKQKAFISSFFEAKPYSPNGIVGSASTPDAARREVMVEKVPLPPFMFKAQNMMAGGLPLGRIINIVSASGTGKSTIIDECVLYWIFHSPYKIGVVSMESDVGQYHIKLLSRLSGCKIDLLPTVAEKLAFLDSERVKQLEHELVYDDAGGNRYWLVEERDGGIESMKQLIMQLIIQCECKVIVLDPIHDLLSSLSLEEQDKFCAYMKGMVKSHGVTFVNVCHTRKTSQGGKQGSQGADLSEEDIMGTSALYKSAACNMVFSRNKEADTELERNTTKMKITKCRWTGNTGLAGEYYYDNQGHTLYDLDTWLNNN